MKNPREVALKGLMNLRRSGTWPDLFLKQELRDMSSEDGRLCASILYGSLENINLIDFYIDFYSNIKIKKIMPQVLDILRMTVYQIIYLEKIPDSAAINEGVKLVKKFGGLSATGFANGLLRTISRQKDSFPQVPKGKIKEYLYIKYSHPKWFISEMIDTLGEKETEELLKANNEIPSITARVNTLKISTVELIKTLQEEGAEVQKSDELSGAVLFGSGYNPIKSKAFEDGLLYVQDMSSQLSVTALEPKRGSTLIDMCASPGGKSIMACQLMKNEGKIYACDIYEHKIKIIRENALKYGAEIIKAQLRNGTIFYEEFDRLADYIICDVPCSGMGIIRKKPDIRFKAEEDVKGLPNVQYQILCNAARYLKVGGSLVYSTCTIRKQENEQVVSRFLSEHKDFELTPFLLPFDIKGDKGYVTLYPHRHGFDGFFIAKLRKKDE